MGKFNCVCPSPMSLRAAARNGRMVRPSEADGYVLTGLIVSRKLIYNLCVLDIVQFVPQRRWAREFVGKACSRVFELFRDI